MKPSKTTEEICERDDITPGVKMLAVALDAINEIEILAGRLKGCRGSLGVASENIIFIINTAKVEIAELLNTQREESL